MSLRKNCNTKMMIESTGNTKLLITTADSSVINSVGKIVYNPRWIEKVNRYKRSGESEPNTVSTSESAIIGVPPKRASACIGTTSAKKERRSTSMKPLQNQERVHAMTTRTMSRKIQPVYYGYTPQFYRDCSETMKTVEKKRNYTRAAKPVAPTITESLKKPSPRCQPVRSRSVIEYDEDLPWRVRIPAPQKPIPLTDRHGTVITNLPPCLARFASQRFGRVFSRGT